MSAEPIEQIAAIGAVIDVIADELDHKAQLLDEQGLDLLEKALDLQLAKLDAAQRTIPEADVAYTVAVSAARLLQRVDRLRTRPRVRAYVPEALFSTTAPWASSRSHRN